MRSRVGRKQVNDDVDGWRRNQIAMGGGFVESKMNHDGYRKNQQLRVLNFNQQPAMPVEIPVPR
jgi:hypothetical protein